MSSESTTPPPPQRRQSFTLPYPSYTSPIALAAASSLRRSSVSSGTRRPRADSLSSLSSSVASSIPADDVPIEEDEDAGDVRSKLERRMSLGSRWVRPRAGSVSLGQVQPGQGSPTITRGFWLDPSLKKRRQSISTMPLPEHVEASMASGTSSSRERRASESAGQPHDPLQERILKGDFIF